MIEIILDDQTLTLYPAENTAYNGDNDYSDVRTVTALEGIGAEVYVTRNGDIQMTTDGETLFIQQ